MKGLQQPSHRNALGSETPLMGQSIGSLQSRQVRHTHQELIALPRGAAAFVDGPDDE
jgi:hypothetical protein